MFAHVKFESALVGLVCIAVVCMNGRASAVTAEVARKCAALTAKAYPPRVSGNPAAGLAKGTAQSKRDYFNKCVANGGNMDDNAPEHPPLPPSRGAPAGFKTMSGAIRLDGRSGTREGIVTAGEINYEDEKL